MAINHGVSFLDPGVEAEAMVELTPVFPRQEASNHINDNYSVVPTNLTPRSQGLNSVFQETPQDLTLLTQVCKQNVFCTDVVSHVPIATTHGQLQKKSLSPGHVLRKIKFVKVVSWANHCLSAPSVLNAPHVVTEISVGGRLQSFWQVW